MIDHQKFFEKILPTLAACLATARIETGIKMQPVQENLNYSAQGLADTFPRKCAVDAKAKPKIPNDKAEQIAYHPEAIANYVYANKKGNESSGDGWKYRGAGYPQTTGRGNYKKIEEAAKTAGHNWLLEQQPELLLQTKSAVFALFEEMQKRTLYR